MLKAPGSLTIVALAIMRLGQFCHRSRGLLPAALRPLWWLLDLLILQLCFEARISPDVLCGPGLHTQHRMKLVSIDAGVVIGSGVTLLGDTKLVRTPEGSPTLGTGAFVATRSAIIGPVNVGEGAVISMGSVVLSDVPGDRMARGNPAALVEPRPA